MAACSFAAPPLYADAIVATLYGPQEFATLYDMRAFVASGYAWLAW